VQNPRTQFTGRRATRRIQAQRGRQAADEQLGCGIQSANISLVNRRELPPPSFPSPEPRKEVPRIVGERLTWGHFISVELRRRITSAKRTTATTFVRKRRPLKATTPTICWADLLERKVPRTSGGPVRSDFYPMKFSTDTSKAFASFIAIFLLIGRTPFSMFETCCRGNPPSNLPSSA
jgi:hypothetical protein